MSLTNHYDPRFVISSDLKDHKDAFERTFTSQRRKVNAHLCPLFSRFNYAVCRRIAEIPAFYECSLHHYYGVLECVTGMCWE